MAVKRAFVIGKRDRASMTLVILCLASGPIAGPWTLKAVVSRN